MHKILWETDVLLYNRAYFKILECMVLTLRNSFYKSHFDWKTWQKIMEMYVTTYIINVDNFESLVYIWHVYFVTYLLSRKIFFILLLNLTVFGCSDF